MGLNDLTIYDIESICKAGYALIVNDGRIVCIEPVEKEKQ